MRNNPFIDDIVDNHHEKHLVPDDKENPVISSKRKSISLGSIQIPLNSAIECPKESSHNSIEFDLNYSDEHELLVDSHIYDNSYPPRPSSERGRRIERMPETEFLHLVAAQTCADSMRHLIQTRLHYLSSHDFADQMKR